MSDTVVHVTSTYSTAQQALDAALAYGRYYHDQGYVVGPPWYLPVPAHGTYPLEYDYEGRVWYGTTDEALLNLFTSHLYELEEDAIAEALEMQAGLMEEGYEVSSVGAESREFDGRMYYRAIFYFGLPGSMVPEPFEEKKTHPAIWVLPISLALTTVAIIVIGTRKR